MSIDRSVLDEPIGGHEVPESATLAMEYLVWLLERTGWVFRHGRMALYWDLIYTLMKHRGDKTVAKPTDNP